MGNTQGHEFSHNFHCHRSCMTHLNSVSVHAPSNTCMISLPHEYSYPVQRLAPLAGGLDNTTCTSYAYNVWGLHARTVNESLICCA